ncbi:MAG: LysM peptidoglycan-binding domain-containing protein [Firmicutes bacterium]|nr:LysM peptidoglycan-binding domain-containing protein [Bacillota bacterium]
MYQIYQISVNDTLASIAQKFNTTIDELRRINGMGMNYLLNPSEYIVVPKTDNGMYQTYVVKKGDNLYQIAMEKGTTVQNLLLINGLEESGYIYPDQQILIPNRGVDIYVTKEETLTDVANKLGVTEQDLINQNQLIYLLPEQIIIYKKREND